MSERGPCGRSGTAEDEGRCPSRSPEYFGQEEAAGRTWRGIETPDDGSPGPAGWARALLRGAALAVLVFGGLAVLLLVRLAERPLAGMDRPVTPQITRRVCRGALWLLGIRVAVRGRPLRGAGAMVANHSSWLDIFVLNAQTDLYFVSKAEVAGWPGIGWLARATGTLFIRRDRREAADQAAIFSERLAHGHRLLFFPEGTSTDGLRVLPFKTTLFQAFFAEPLRHRMRVQAVTVIFHPPEGESPRFYGWWGDMAFGPHLLKTLAARRQGRVELVFHPALRVDDFPNRKTLAHKLEVLVRDAHPSGRVPRD